MKKSSAGRQSRRLTLENYALRPARAADTRFVFETNSHPSVREQSIAQGSISWESHQAWFDRGLTLSSRKMFILEAAGTPVAFGRLDDEHGTPVLSVAVHHDARGCGHGRALVALLADHPACDAGATAYIRTTNIASQRAFTAAGFVFETMAQVQGVELMRWVFPAGQDDSEPDS